MSVVGLFELSKQLQELSKTRHKQTNKQTNKQTRTARLYEFMTTTVIVASYGLV